MLHTLGALYYGSFHRIKPLLVLTYVALEGQTPRRSLARMLWPDARQADASLRTALYQLREIGSVFDAEDPLCTDLPCDARHLLEKRGDDTLRAYPGAFLHGVDLQGVSAEFEEWVLTQRERLALHVQTETLSAAEKSDPTTAARLTEQVYRLPGAAPATAELLKRCLALTLPGSALESEIGLELASLPSADAPAPVKEERHKRMMIGRHAELDALLAWATTTPGGIASLSGPGGIGKSTLGRELLRELKLLGHDVHHLDAEGVKHASELVARLIAQTGAAQASADTWKSLGKRLGEKPVILLDGVDTLEHLPDMLQDATRTLPQVQWVVTSRQSRLGLPAASSRSSTRRGLVGQGHNLPVFALHLGGLECPSADADYTDAQDSSATQLFIREGQRVRRDFFLTPDNAPLMISLTRRLQGHPLALALAASWLRVESLPEVHTRVLAQAATLEDASQTQRGLTLVVQRSWELLNPEQQNALLSASVFSDFDPQDAISIGIPETHLNALLEHSFLETYKPGSERLRLYPALDSVRTLYAPQHPQLIQEARHQHAQHYLAWFTIQSPTAPAVSLERENIRLALHTALEGHWLTPEPVYHLMSHYDNLAIPATGTDIFQDLIEATEQNDAPDDVKAAAQIGCMWLAQRADRLTQAQAMAERFLESPLADDPQNKMKALNTLAVVHKQNGEYAKTAKLTEEGLSIANQENDIARQAIYMINLLDCWISLGAFNLIEKNLKEFSYLIEKVDIPILVCNLQLVTIELPNPDYTTFFEKSSKLIERFQKSNESLSEIQMYSFNCLALERSGRYKECINLSREVLSRPDISDLTEANISILFSEVRSLYALGMVIDARKLANQGMILVSEHKKPYNCFEAFLSIAHDISTNSELVNLLLNSIYNDSRADFRQRQEAKKLMRPINGKNAQSYDPCEILREAQNLLMESIEPER